MKKIISLILSVIMIMSVFAGCGNDSGSVSELYNPDLKIADTGGLKMPLTDSTDPYTWLVASSASGLEESFVVKKIREATGVNLQLIVLPLSTAGEKVKVLAASNSLPDVTGQGVSGDFGDDLCVQGAFAAVQDYFDVLPNYKRTFIDSEERSYVLKSSRQTDGKVYGFNGWDLNRDVNHGLLYRKDIFDKHGIKMWNSPEEFYQVLKKLKELYPQSTPFVSKNTDGIFDKLVTSWGMRAHIIFYDEETGKWYFADVLPEYKEFLDYIKKLYNEDLLDPEFLTTTQAQWSSKMTQADKAFVTYDWIGRLEQFTNQTASTVPGYDLRFGNPIGPDQTYPTLSQLVGAKFVKKSNKERETVAFQLCDFLLSPAGKELITMGIEGETFEYDENGKVMYIGYDGKVPEMNDLEEKYGMFLQGMYLSFDRRSSYYQFSEREQEAQDYATVEGNMSPVDPVLVYEPEEKERVNEISSVISKAAKEFSTKYILNKSYGDKEWNEWLKEAERLNYKEWENIANEAQKRYDAM